MSDTGFCEAKPPPSAGSKDTEPVGGFGATACAVRQAATLSAWGMPGRPQTPHVTLSLHDGRACRGTLFCRGGLAASLPPRRELWVLFITPVRKETKGGFFSLERKRGFVSWVSVDQLTNLDTLIPPAVVDLLQVIPTGHSLPLNENKKAPERLSDGSTD